MSSNAIIAGLKQGNSMEMATIEEVKAGMTSVLDGMLRECFNRSDGLSELTERLQLEDPSATAANITAEQRLHLKKAIKDAIRNCEEAISVNDRKEDREIEQATTAFKAEKKMLNILRDYSKSHARIYHRKRDWMDTISTSASFYSSLKEQLSEESELICDFEDDYEDAKADFKAREAVQFEEIAQRYQKEEDAFKKQITSLERIAIIANIDLKATSTDETANRVLSQTSQAALRIPTFSDIGRGRGRGGISSMTRGLSGRGMLGGRGGHGSFQSRPTDPLPSIPDSQGVTVDDLRRLGR